MSQQRESSIASRESQSRPSVAATRKRKCPLRKNTYANDENDEIEIISVTDSSEEEGRQRQRKCVKRDHSFLSRAQSASTRTLRSSRSQASKQSAHHNTKSTSTKAASKVAAMWPTKTESKIETRSKQFRSEALSIATPNSLSHYSSRSSPLPNINWADSREVWELMLHKDAVYQRNPLLLHRHSSLQPRMRSILIDWLSEVCEVYRLHRETYYLSVDFIDRYLSNQFNIPKQQLQLLGITCLFIAAKIEEIYPPKISEFSYVTDGACNEDEIITKELVILKALNWDLYPMTINSWLTIYMQLYATLEKENTVRSSLLPDGDLFLIPEYQTNLFAQVAHLIDLCILDIGSLTYSYSVIAASALYHFTNENIVHQCTGLPMSQIRECVIWMIPFALAIRDEGFDNPRLKQRLEEDGTSLSNIQSHTVDLQLLEKAHVKQCERDAEETSESEASPSPISSPIASRVDVLTPPKSNSKVRH